MEHVVYLYVCMYVCMHIRIYMLLYYIYYIYMQLQTLLCYIIYNKSKRCNSGSIVFINN